jgi:hypothetical protein
MVLSFLLPFLWFEWFKIFACEVPHVRRNSEPAIASDG